MRMEVPEWPYTSPTPEALLESARRARVLAYAPYSNFKVGASVLTDAGKVFCGCNIENSSFSLTLCAERVALFSAVASGSGKPVAVAIAGEGGLPCVPCGACLQVLSEFNDDFLIVLEAEETARVYRLDDLLPLRFRLTGNNP